MSDSHCTRPSQRCFAWHLAQQRTLRLTVVGVFLFLAQLAGAVEVVGVGAVDADNPELDITGSNSEGTNLDLVQVVRQYGPRMAVSTALLMWGVLVPELPGPAMIELPPGESATLNAALSRAGTAAALLTMGTATAGRLICEWPDTFSAVSASSAVIASAYVARSYLKARFRRTRPVAVLAGSIDDPDDRQSFPSGHALLAWACVGDALVGTVRGTTNPWLLATVTAEAVAVCCLRVTAGEHYPGDVIAGAVIGLAVGSIVSAVLLPL